MPTRVLTIMITDIKGFTERTSTTSREDLRKLIDEHEALLLPYVGQFGGKLVKTMGDAFLVAFESPTNAVLCAVMMQEKLREYNEDRPDERKMEVRIAINSGEVEIREDDVFGEAVNIAARIEGITEATEIYFTEAVYLAMNKAEVPTSEVGFRRFKGLPEAIKIYLPDNASNDDGAAAREAIIGNINDGAVLLNYIGHGGYDYLSDQRMLFATDAAGMTNVEQLPVFLAMTCVSGDFAAPWTSGSTSRSS